MKNEARGYWTDGTIQAKKIGYLELLAGECHK
jgi:hypothetical protein